MVSGGHLNSDAGAHTCHESTSVQAARLKVGTLVGTGRRGPLQVSQPAFLALGYPGRMKKHFEIH